MLRIALLSLFSLTLIAQSTRGPVTPGTRRPNTRPAPGTNMPTATPQIKLEAAGENRVLARIGNVTYYESDFYDFLPIVYQPQQLTLLSGNPEMMKQARERYLESMLLVELAKKEGVEKTPEFLTKLDGVTKTLLIQEIIGQKTPELEKLSTPTEEQMKAHYEENIKNYADEKASARHILVMTRNNESETDKPTDEEALAKVAKIKEELRRGKNWQEAALEYSDDPGSKEKGGLYEDFPPSQMVPEFAEAVRTQKIGVIGEPVRTQFGYHLILVESYTDSPKTFDEVKSTVQKLLTEKMRNETWAVFIASVKAELGYEEAKEAGEVKRIAPREVSSANPM